MTTMNLTSVGFCAHYSELGDAAFDFALALARARGLHLNVFHFLADPYGTNEDPTVALPPEARRRVIIERERELRMYYDERLGDFVDVGFRLCEDRGWLELHRCLTRREFQVLVLVRPDYGVRFAGKPLEEFADGFVCPVVLIGPSASTEYRLNSPARMIADRLGLARRLAPSWPSTGTDPCAAC
jgi:hypothetical protein